MTVVPQPSRERLTELFVSLAKIPSPSLRERLVGDAVIEALRGVGLEVREDDAGTAIGGDCGNLVCLVGPEGSRPTVALGAHLDTVAPTDSIEPELGRDGVFRNARRTILGADDKAAIAALIHATELLVESGMPCVSYEMLLTVCEEEGLQGAKNLDLSNLKSPMAVVLDSTGPVGGIVTRAPNQKVLRGRYRGLAAHAGLEPEVGRSAIYAAAKAVARMRLGRLDADTTANIGTISGGVATNIVPEACEVAGECRSHDAAALAQVTGEMVDALHLAATENNVDVEVDVIDSFQSYSIDEEAPVVQVVRKALETLDIAPRLLTAGGGSDANILNLGGIPTVNLTTGMMRAHSAEEHISLDELERLCEVAMSVVMTSSAQGEHGASRIDESGR